MRGIDAYREKLLATGLALTWLAVWLQVFLPYVAPADPLNPNRYLLGGDTAIICTIEGMKVVRLSDLPQQEEDGSDQTAGMGSYGCPRVAAQSLTGAVLPPEPIEFSAPRVFAVAWLPATAARPRAPPPPSGFSARAPPFNA